jgi:hypothetical protein
LNAYFISPMRAICPSLRNNYVPKSVERSGLYIKTIGTHFGMWIF